MHVPKIQLSNGLLALIILAASFTGFASALKYDFVFDDSILIVQNYRLRNWHFILDSFHLQEEDTSAYGSTMNTGHYRPLVISASTIAYHLFGLDSRWWHFTNILFHLIVVLFVFLILLELGFDKYFAGLSSLLFALHPVHSEAVAWVDVFLDTLLGIFFFASLYLFLRAEKPGSNFINRWLSFLLFFLALLCKETAIVLPLVIVAYGLIVTGVDRKGLQVAAKSSLPYFCILGFYFIFRRVAFGSLKIVVHAPLLTTIKTLPLVIQKYLTNLLLPTGLSPMYSLRSVSSFRSLQFIIPVIVLTIVAAILYLLLRSADRKFVFILIAPVLVILPVLNLGLLPPERLVQDRYLYIPSLGFCALLAWGILRLNRAYLRLSLASVSIIFYFAMLVMQNGYWADNETLFRRAIAIDPSSSMAHYNLGLAFFSSDRLDGADKEFRNALSLKPGYAEALAALGLTAFKRGEYSVALNQFRTAYPLFNNPPSWIYVTYSLAEKVQGNKAQALSILNQGAVLYPDFAELFLLRGAILFENKQTDEALRDLEKAAELNPSAMSHIQFGKALAQANQLDKAKAEFRKALLLDPTNIEAKRLLGSN